MGVLDEFGDLAATFVQEFNNGVAGGGGGADLYMRRRALGAYDAATQKRATTPTTTTKIDRYSRTGSQVFTAPGSSGAMRKFEEFFVVVVIADAVAAGWPAPGGTPLQPDETCELLVGVGGAGGVYPVVSCQRVMKESAWRMKVRRDMGPAT